MSLFQLSNSEGFMAQNKFYNELLDKQKLTDVTLACDDGFQIRVHRTIIAASSLFFREVIMSSNNPNPFIYLRGVNQENLQSLLRFIYVGETTVETENMDDLVALGNELKIVGLMEMEVDTKKESNGSKTPQVTPNTRKKRKVKKDRDSEENVNDTTKVKSEEDFATNKNLSDLAAEIEKRLSSRKDEHDRIIHICTVCGKENGRRHEIKLHIETHLEGFQHKCPFCGVSKSTRAALKQHQNLFCKFDQSSKSFVPPVKS